MFCNKLDYTKGEWGVGVCTIKGFGDIEHIAVAIKSDLEQAKVVASTGMAGAEDEPESIANAHLIAAAPEMYEALKAFERYGSKHAVHKLIKEALLKAEGY